MKFWIGVGAILLAMLLAVGYVQTSPAFALLEDECRCVNGSEAREDCITWCGLANPPAECLFVYLIGTGGDCVGEKCFTRWQFWCTDNDKVTYWQYQDCWVCGLL